MTRRYGGPLAAALGVALLMTATPDALTQPPDKGFGGKGGGFGPPGGAERKLVKDFDKNGDGWLNGEERPAAREAAKKDGGRGGFGGPKGGFGPGGGRGKDAPKSGPRVSPGDVKSYPDSGLYEPTVLRTLFLEFENPDWEAELQDFHGTDVEVPATLTVDGKRYPNVGVHFRGMSSYGGVPAGFKRSLNLAVDLADPKQRLYGYKTLNLLNSHEDPSFLSTVLYSHVARQYMPAPKANVVKVVINGESWGVYTNVQQFNKEFTAENYKSAKGARWKVRGSPGGGGGLEYLGDSVDAYKRRYEIKSGDDEKAWKDFINLCRVLNETPAEKLEAALKPILDVDELLWFLALDVALVNNDGYWVRASDYSIYRDEKGRFHVVPHDMNEALRGGGGGPGGMGPGGFAMRLPAPGTVLPLPLQDMLRLTDDQKKQVEDLQKEVDGKLDKLLTGDQKAELKRMREAGPGGFGGPPGGPGGPGGFGQPGGPGAGPGGPGPGPGGPGGGGRGGPGGFGGGPGGGVQLDPLVALNDSRKPLRSKVLAVPALRAKYLANVRTIAEKSLDWKVLGPVVAQYRELIDKEIEADTRKLETTEAFRRATADAAEAGGQGARGMSLRAFADARRKFLLDNAEVKKATP